MTITLTADQTLAEIVNTRPAAARTFEAHNLDYCCGGRRTLADACAESGTDTAFVMEQVNASEAEGQPDWMAMEPAALVDHIEAAHHSYLSSELSRIDALVEKVSSKHGDRHPELLEVRATWGELRAELEPHLMKEERVLFPMIRDLAASDTTPEFHCGSLGNPISVMLSEHDHAGHLLASLRAQTDGYRPPDDACTSYRVLYDALGELEADTHLHIHKENNVLFPAVLAMETSNIAGSSAHRT